MKRMKMYLLLALFLSMGCLFFTKDNAKAANSDFYKKFSGQGEDWKECSFKLKYKCKMKITVNFSSRSSGDSLDVELLRYDEDKWDDVSVFSKSVYGKKSSFEKTITLPAGEYDLAIVSEVDDLYYDDYDDIDDTYDDEDDIDDAYDDDYDAYEKSAYRANGKSEKNQYSVILSGNYIPELSLRELSLEEGKTKTLKVNGTKKSVKWGTSNKSIATVNNKGIVKAKKPGKATITAKCGTYTLKCKVTVTKKPASYNEISKKMKEFAKKNKNFTFKNMDVGSECRLYARGGETADGSKIQSEGYFMHIGLQPYIQLVKKKGKPEMRLRMQGELRAYSIRSTNLYCSEMRVTTSNRKMKFSMKHTSGRNYYNYTDQLYIGKMKGYATISTSSKVNEAALKKFKTMLGQKSFAIRLKSYDGAYFQIGISKTFRNNWKKLVNEYSTLLKEF